MSELAIPDAAVDAADIFGGQIRRGDLRVQIANAAPHIVAAELRRLADQLDVVKAEMREVDDRTIRSSGLGEGIARLRARADELDGGAR